MARTAEGRVDKVVRIVGTSTRSWEDAARAAIGEATKTVRELFVARVADLDVDVRAEGQYVYRVLLELAFRLDRTRATAAGPVQVRRFLVVADTTLPSSELREVVTARSTLGPAEFHVLVPRDPERPLGGMVLADPLSGYMVPTDLDEAEARAAAQERLQDFVQFLSPHALSVTGEIGPAHPLRALHAVLERASFDEIIVATLPSAVSRWLHMDLPARIRRATHLPVVHVQDARVAATEPPAAG